MPSIEKRGNNSWRLVVEDGYDAKGKRVRHRKSVTIEDPALLKSAKKLGIHLQMELALFQRLIESGQYIRQERTTFADFVPTWKANYADLNMGEYTRRNYQAIVNIRLIPAFGHLEMGKIKTMHVVHFLTQLRAPEGRLDGRNKPLSTNTILNIYKTLKSILDAAAKWKVILSNPMAGVDRPVADKAEKRALKTAKHSYTLAEAGALIEVLQDEPEHWRLYFLGALLGGFRRGEMLAIQWSQVDFAAGGIHVEKQISLSEDGKRTEADVKTIESAAFVPMPRWYMAELEKYKKVWNRERLRQGKNWLGADKQYLFHPGQGLSYHPDTASKRWRKVRAKYNLPSIRLHDLRHTTATLLREDGASLKDIQERLRHTRLATTADLYTHETELVSRGTADRFEKLNPVKSQTQ